MPLFFLYFYVFLWCLKCYKSKCSLCSVFFWSRGYANKKLFSRALVLYGNLLFVCLLFLFILPNIFYVWLILKQLKHIIPWSTIWNFLLHNGKWNKINDFYLLMRTEQKIFFFLSRALVSFFRWGYWPRPFYCWCE